MSTNARIESIFYARFHDEHGPRVFHQVPEGSIIPCPPSPTAMKEPLVDFQSISTRYIIPNREFCNRPLSVCWDGHRVLGYPVCITDESKYDRNDFIFNFCIVLDEKSDWSPWQSIVNKLARLFRNLEEQDSFLSREEQDDTVLVAGTEGYGGEKGSKVFAVVEMVFEDLKAVGEAMIPIDESNTLNLCLFPNRQHPPKIERHHVPLSVAHFSSMQTSAWDLTIQRILPHIDGINSVAQIAERSDTDPSLTSRAIQHLVYHHCVLLLDIFSFAAIYAPTPHIASFVADLALQDECRRYIYSHISPFGKPAQDLVALAGATNQATSTTLVGPSIPSRTQVVALYSALRPSLPLRDFCLARASQLTNIDVRRFITFGVLNGFLYRAHKYAVQPSPGGKDRVNATGKGAVAAAGGELDRQVGSGVAGGAIGDQSEEAAWRVAALSSGWRLPDGDGDEVAGSAGARTAVGKKSRRSDRARKVEEAGRKDAVSTTTSTLRRREGRDVLRWANGLTCLDAMCTEWKMTEREVVERMRRAGDVVFITK